MEGCTKDEDRGETSLGCKVAERTKFWWGDRVAVESRRVAAASFGCAVRVRKVFCPAELFRPMSPRFRSAFPEGFLLPRSLSLIQVHEFVPYYYGMYYGSRMCTCTHWPRIRHLQ